MAFTNFYLIAGGAGSADINAGSSIGAAQVTTTNGSWSTVTGIFIATGGTPFASTIVGDYASVYVDGATVAVFVGIVTTVTSSLQITIDIATIKYGTAPTTSATGRSCTINGSWNTEQVLAAGGLATTTVPQSTKINCKGNLTITANRTISMAGATTTPLWFSGYNTTPGDLDNDTTNSLAKPVCAFNATFGYTWSGAHQLWTSFSLTGAITGSVLTAGGGGTMRVQRIRVENTSANASARAANFNSGSATVIAYCWFKCPTTATAASTVLGNSAQTYVGCVSEGGGTAGFDKGNSTVTYINCIGLSNTGQAFSTNATNAASQYLNCTAYGASADGMRFTGTLTVMQAVVGCLFVNCGGYGINQNTGTATNCVYRACNDFYNNTSGTENGFGDSPAFFGQTEAGSPVTSATDMTPVGGSNARNNGFPGIFENETFSSYPDIGAVRHADPTSISQSVAIFGG